MLHTLVPHVHFETVSEVATLHTHDSSVNLFMDLQISLGLSHGAGDFEQYVEFDTSPDIFTIPVSSPVLLVKPNCDYAEKLAINFEKEAFLDLDRLRGPPAS